MQRDDRIAAFRITALGTLLLASGGLFAQPDAAEARNAEERTSTTSHARTMEGIVVTGSRLPAAEAQTMQDVHIYPRERIEQSDKASLSEFLATLPEVSLNSVESTDISTTVKLRGADRGTALILLNGRRTESVTGSAGQNGYFDLNTIPLSMVERIEILPAGSSAIYGGQALAGVVNIVLRSGFTGYEVNAGYKWADQTDEKVFWGGAGWKGNDLALSMMASYSERGSLEGKDRAITRTQDLRYLGGPNLGIAALGSPANVSSVSGNLPGLHSSFATVPHGSTGIGLTPNDFLATQGTQNTASFTQYQSSLFGGRRAGFFASADYRLSSAVDLFGEFLTTEYKYNFAFTPPIVQLLNVPASNPYNPFGTTVRVTGLVMGAESLFRSDYRDTFVRPLVGARRIGRHLVLRCELVDRRRAGALAAEAFARRPQHLAEWNEPRQQAAKLVVVFPRL